MNGQIKYIYTMQIYSTIKINNVIVHAIFNRMNIENTMLRKEASYKRPQSVFFHLYGISRTGKSLETESRLVNTWRGGSER